MVFRVRSVFNEDDGIERKVNIKLIFSDTLNVEIYINVDSQDLKVLQDEEFENLLKDTRFSAPCMYDDLALTSEIANKIMKIFKTKKLKEFFVKLYNRDSTKTLEKILVKQEHNLIEIYFGNGEIEEDFKILIKIKEYGKMNIIKFDYENSQIKYSIYKDNNGEKSLTKVEKSKLSIEEERKLIKEKNNVAKQLYIVFKRIYI